MQITIENDGYCAVIDPDRGANCIALRSRKYGASILREPPAGKPWDNPYLYGMPILFPVNRISGGSFVFEGRNYRYPVNEPATGCHLHGTLHETPFTVLEREEHRLLCSYQAEEKGYLQFPHAFEIRMEYALRDDGMHHTIWVRNLSDTNMPVMLGFHTTFNALFLPDSRPGDVAVKAQLETEYRRNMANYLPTGETPAFDAVSQQLNAGTLDPMSQSLSRHYRCALPGNMVLYDRRADVSVLYENDEKLPFRLIYNGGADGYICLEPQTCLANCANAPIDRQAAGFDWLAPGSEKQYRSRITIQKGDLR